MNSRPAPYSSFVLVLLLASVASCSLFAQRVTPLLRKGQAAMEVEDYYTAIHYYQQALLAKPTLSTRYALAEAARKFKAYDLALEQYEWLADQPGGEQYPLLPLHTGICYQSMGNYAEAQSNFEQFLATAKGNAQQKAQAQAGRLACEWAMQQPMDTLWTTTRLARRINSPYAEFGAYFTNDTLYFSSYRFEKEDDKYLPKRKISKVQYSTDLQRGRNLRRFNADTVLTAHTAISQNKQKLYFNRCRYTEGAKIRCELCVRSRDRRGRWSAKWKVLPSPVNLAGFTATQPAMMWDTITMMESLLFVSDRPGGQGGYDIWQVPIPVGKEEWTEPQPLTAVNTPQNDISPYFLVENQQLYFSSERTPSFGGYDLYQQAYLGSEKWGLAVNIGAPINTSYDETYPFWVVDQSRVFYSSNQPGGRYLDPATKACCPDIFKASYQSSVPPEATSTDTTVLAVVPVVPTKPVQPKIPRSLEEFLPLKLYFDNDYPNPRTRKSTTELSYADTYFDYLGREDLYYEAFADELDKQEQISDFFSQAVEGGFQNLDRFSSILLEQLSAGQTVEIFLKGYTSPRAKGDYNLLLGRRRVSAVRNHFLSWKSGILQAYLESGQLIISEVSFGETKASSAAKDERAGEKLSIYSADAAAERRVEIVEVKRN